MCTACGREQSLTEFWRKRKNDDRLREKCKTCTRAKHRNAHLVRKFGITEQAYDAIHAAQGGACAICGGNNRGQRLHTDHDHETDEIRGLLCYPCNALLGYAYDDIETLASAITYLSRSNA